MASHPCAGRSQTAVETFEAIAVGQRGPYHPKTIQALLKAGLIELTGYEVVGRDRFGVIKIPVYSVPLPLHFQWCAWCAAQDLSDCDTATTASGDAVR